MSGLTDKDIRVLSSYAKEGNRELYWNYLAQLPDNDGYGLLGCCAQRQPPGRVANSFATAVAEQQATLFGNEKNVAFTERRQDLIRNDLAERRSWMEAGRPDLALNLPYTSTLKSHDVSFEKNDLNVNCWTPRLLLVSTEHKRGEQAAERSGRTCSTTALPAHSVLARRPSACTWICRSPLGISTSLS